jgi:chorismate dehydratase
VLDRKIRVGAVSYLNTKPMITGLEKLDEIDLRMDYPAKIATALLENTIDIGLVPVAIIPKLKEAHILMDYGIGCNGAVASVCLFSEVPITEIETILLDYQSRTSVQLLKILLKEYWKKEVQLVETTGAFETNISGTTGGLIIGDRAFAQKNGYVYDLGAIWKKHTGLPFVFATWVSNKKIDAAFIVKFTQQIKVNTHHFLQNLDAYFSSEQPKKYLTENIQYHLTTDYQKGLALFLGKL